MTGDWFYAREGKSYGPISSEKLGRLAADEHLQPHDLVWQEGMADWGPAVQVPGLFTTANPGRTASPPPLPNRAKGPAAGKAGPPPLRAELLNGMLDAAMSTARRARDYATSDEAKEMVERTRRAAAGVGEKARGLAISTLGEDKSLWREHPIVIGLSLLFCFPVGLYFVWTNPRWTKNAKWAWTGGFVGLLLLGSLASKKEDEAGRAGKQDKLPEGARARAETPPAEKVPGVESKARRGDRDAPEPGPAVAREERAPAVVPAEKPTRSTAKFNNGVFTDSWDYKNGCQILFDRTVTRDEARRLGDLLEGQGAFDGDTKTLRLGKPGKTYEVRIVIKKGLEQDPELIQGMKETSLELSQSLFGGAPVDIHLCDDRMKTLRVVVP